MIEQARYSRCHISDYLEYLETPGPTLAEICTEIEQYEKKFGNINKARKIDRSPSNGEDD